MLSFRDKNKILNIIDETLGSVTKTKLDVNDLNKCFECGSTKKIEQHHVIPKSKGGTKTIPLCISCHSKVHDVNFLNFRKLAADGRMRSMKNGVKMGRKVGSSELLEIFLNKPLTLKIKEHLLDGMSVRLIIQKLSCSPKTVCKVNSYLKSKGLYIKPTKTIRKRNPSEN